MNILRLASLLFMLFPVLTGCMCADEVACSGPTTREELEPNDDAANATRLIDDDLYVTGTCSAADPSDWFVRGVVLGEDPQDAVAGRLSWTAPGSVRIRLIGPSIESSDDVPFVDSNGFSTLTAAATLTTAGDIYFHVLCLDSSSSVTYDGRFGPAGLWD